MIMFLRSKRQDFDDELSRIASANTKYNLTLIKKFDLIKKYFQS